MSLGRHEEHRTLALRPAPARGACLHCVRAGQYEVRVLQCVGHFLHELAEGSKVVTLTLVTLIHLPNPNPNLIPNPNPDPNLIPNPNPKPDPKP